MARRSRTPPSSTKQPPPRHEHAGPPSEPPRPAVSGGLGLGARIGRLTSFEGITPFVWIVLALILVFWPIAGLFRKSFSLPEGGIGFANYFAVAQESGALRACFNSLWIGAATTAGTLLIAVPLAFFVSRTDMPGRGVFRSVAVLTFAAPSFIAAMGWILLLGPRSGLINEFLTGVLGLPAFNIFSPWGIIFVLTFFLYPLLFLPVTAALDNMDGRLEEAAASVGGSRFVVLRKVTLPLITPSIFSGSLLVFISAFVIFGPVALLGSPVGFDTIPTAMLSLMLFPPRIEYAAVLGVPVLAVLAILLYLQRRVYGRRRYVTVGGKPAASATIRLGAWRWAAFAAAVLVIFLSLGLPYGILLLTSFRETIGVPLTLDNMVLFENYRPLLEQPRIFESFVNSLSLALLGTVASILVAIIAVWTMERSRSRVRSLVQPSMLAPLAFPGAILGIAMIIAYAGAPFGIGGTLLIMGLAYLIRVVPLSFSYVHAGLRQIGTETEEAARSLGASWTQTLRRITVPLLRGPILSVAVLNFVLLFRELDISIFLYTGTNTVAPVVLYNLAMESRFAVMGALSVVILAINLGIVALAQKFFGARFATSSGAGG